MKSKSIIAGLAALFIAAPLAVWAVCGNGILETSSEECDDGKQCADRSACTSSLECVGQTGDQLCIPRSGDGCSATCINEIDPRCGDGILQAHPNGFIEECDDGIHNSDIDGDACRTDCELPHCGDDVLDPGYGEICDGPDPNDIVCRFDCIPNVCGDEILGRGHINGFDETCDDGDWIDNGCSVDCLQAMSACGNGAINSGEGCDDGPLNSDAPNAACRTNCQPARCGDGITDDQADPPEQCDGDPGCQADCRWLQIVL